MKRAPILIIIFIISSISCKTAPSFQGKTDIRGMVYDFDNRPIAGYTIAVDGGKETVTDVTGRFTIIGIPAGEYHIEGRGKNYESYQGNLSLHDEKQIMYLRIPSIPQLLALADTALAENRLEDAGNFIIRALCFGETNGELLFYQAIWLFRKGAYKEAVNVLEHAINTGSRNPYMYIFLADLYQYFLNDTVHAEKYLRLYVSSTQDEAAVKRMEEIKQHE